MARAKGRVFFLGGKQRRLMLKRLPLSRTNAFGKRLHRNRFPDFGKRRADCNGIQRIIGAAPRLPEHIVKRRAQALGKAQRAAQI